MTRYCFCWNSNRSCEMNYEGRVGTGGDSMISGSLLSTLGKQAATLLSILGLREVGTMVRVEFRRIAFTMLSSSRTVEGLMLQQVHDDVALRSCSRVISMRAAEVGSKRARWTWNIWKVSDMNGLTTSSWHGALDTVSAKCKREPFLYTTVKS